ncbi:hypothetical protein MTP99_019801 [Tenebrio molitor]|nr:hypothetical protein MTP99_019801 [Tenebrio molitor]
MPSSRTEPNQSTRGRGAPAPQHRHHRHTRSPGSFHRCLRSPFVPTASPDMPISELVSRRTTVETPGSLNPQPARRRRIREDATVPQPSAIPTRTSPGRLSPRAPTASPDSTSARRSQRLEPKRPRTSTSCRFSRAVRAQRQPLDKSTEPTIGGSDHEKPCRCASLIVAQRHRGGCPPGQLRLPEPREARRDVGQPAARDRPHKIEDDTPRRPMNIRGANGSDEKHRVCVVCA